MRGFLETLEPFRDAVGTAQIAAVGDGKPQVFDGAPKTVDEHGKSLIAVPIRKA